MNTGFTPPRPAANRGAIYACAAPDISRDIRRSSLFRIADARSGEVGSRSRTFLFQSKWGAGRQCQSASGLWRDARRGGLSAPSPGGVVGDNGLVGNPDQ